jgi:hypothetical protein
MWFSSWGLPTQKQGLSLGINVINLSIGIMDMKELSLEPVGPLMELLTTPSFDN